MTQKKTQGTVSFGGPTVLTVLIVLCFACFSLLALSRASADYRLTARAAQTVSAYYAAESRVQTVLAGLRAGEPAEVEEQLATLAAQNGVEATISADGAQVTLYASAGSQGVLTTEVRLRTDGADAGWTVLSSRVVPDDPEQSSSTMPVYQ